MCDPVSITGLVVAVAGAALQYDQGRQAANANQDAINANLKQQQETFREQQIQINKNAVDQEGQVARQAAQARSHLIVAGGESGLADNSGRDLWESMFNQSQDIAGIEANRAAGIAQSKLEARGAAVQAQGAINTVNSQRPTLFGTGLQIAGAGLDAYSRNAKYEQGRVKTNQPARQSAPSTFS